MIGDDSFVHDFEFQKLMARDNDVDLVTVALELARDANAELQFDQTLEWLDAQALKLKPVVIRSRTEHEALQALSDHLGTTCELGGDTDAYSQAASSYLDRVVIDRRGIPITLSVIYMAVAERVGIELSGVAAPAHFLTRSETVDGPVFIDAFSGGRLMDTEECVGWISQVSHLGPSDVLPMLRAADRRSIVIRMLNNLKVLHSQQEDWSAARRVQQRLLALKPGRYEEQRDFALLSARTIHTSDAIKLLERCLQVCPEGEREALTEELEKARKRQAQWN